MGIMIKIQAEVDFELWNLIMATLLHAINFQGYGYSEIEIRKIIALLDQLNENNPIWKGQNESDMEIPQE